MLILIALTPSMDKPLVAQFQIHAQEFLPHVAQVVQDTILSVAQVAHNMTSVYAQELAVLLQHIQATCIRHRL